MRWTDDEPVLLRVLFDVGHFPPTRPAQWQQQHYRRSRFRLHELDTAAIGRHQQYRGASTRPAPRPIHLKQFRRFRRTIASTSRPPMCGVIPSPNCSGHRPSRDGQWESKSEGGSSYPLSAVLRRLGRSWHWRRSRSPSRAICGRIGRGQSRCHPVLGLGGDDRGTPPNKRHSHCHDELQSGGSWLCRQPCPARRKYNRVERLRAGDLEQKVGIAQEPSSENNQSRLVLESKRSERKILADGDTIGRQGDVGRAPNPGDA